MELAGRGLDWALPPRRRSRRSSIGTFPSRLPRSSSWPRWRGPRHHLWCPTLRQLHRECRETFWGLAGAKKCDLWSGEAVVCSTLDWAVNCQFHPAQSWLACLCWLWSGVELGVASKEANIYHTLQLSCPSANPSLICFLPTLLRPGFTPNIKVI